MGWADGWQILTRSMELPVLSRALLPRERQHARLDRGPFVEGRNLVAGVVLGAALEDLVLVSVHKRVHHHFADARHRLVALDLIGAREVLVTCGGGASL